MTEPAISLHHVQKVHKSDLTIQLPNTKKSVLIIEDMSEMRSMLKSLVVSLGFTNIDVEPSGQAAIKRILSTHYDIVLSDYNLGGTINGQQILEVTRKVYALDHSTIFIMITADTAYENVVSILEYQPDCYIVKPFTPAAFKRRFEQVQKQKTVFNEINKLRKKHDFANMVIQAKKIMLQYPRYNSLCLKIVGESLFALQRYAEALKHYSLIIQNHNSFAWAHYGAAQCEMKLGNVSIAIESLIYTIELSRHFLSAYDLLADAQEQLGNYEEAQAAIIRAIEVSPYSVERSKRLGELSEGLKDWQTAERAYSRVIRLTRDTQDEEIGHYYRHLQSITNLTESGDHSPKVIEKFRRSVIRLRILGQGNPIVVTNSYRAEVQHYLNRGHQQEAIKSWKKWNHQIEKGQASAINASQIKVIKKRLSLL